MERCKAAGNSQQRKPGGKKLDKTTYDHGILSLCLSDKGAKWIFWFQRKAGSSSLLCSLWSWNIQRPFFFVCLKNLSILSDPRTDSFVSFIKKRNSPQSCIGSWFSVSPRLFQMMSLRLKPHNRPEKEDSPMHSRDNVTAQFLIPLKSHPKCKNLLFSLHRRDMPEVSLGPPWNLLSALWKMPKLISSWILLRTETCLLQISAF